MLRRKQVMISDWLDDSIQYVSNRYDISYSEVIRVSVAYFLGGILAEADPKYKMSVSWKDIAKLVEQSWDVKADLEETRQVIYDIYGEAKKILKNRSEEIKNTAGLSDYWPEAS